MLLLFNLKSRAFSRMDSIMPESLRPGGASFREDHNPGRNADIIFWSTSRCPNDASQFFGHGLLEDGSEEWTAGEHDCGASLSIGPENSRNCAHGYVIVQGYSHERDYAKNGYHDVSALRLAELRR
jgi:hypothetical protein